MEEKKGGFKVNDHRRFDTDGNDRNEIAGISQKTASPRSESIQGEGFMTKESSSGHAPEITFTSFVMSLATQALMQLGQLPAPGGAQMEIDIPGAKQVIEILGMLEKKTAGNLDPEEAKLFQDILHGVRLSFVQMTSKK